MLNVELDTISIIMQYGSNCLIGIMKVWGFQPKNISQKPASHFLFNSLIALVRHSKAKICLQIVAMKF